MGGAFAVQQIFIFPRHDRFEGEIGDGARFDFVCRGDSRWGATQSLCATSMHMHTIIREKNTDRKHGVS